MNTKNNKIPSEVKRAEYLLKKSERETNKKRQDMLEMYDKYNLDKSKFNINHLPIDVGPIFTQDFTAEKCRVYMNNLHENKGELTLPKIQPIIDTEIMKVKTKQEIDKENNDWELISDMLFNHPELNIKQILEILKISHTYYDYLNKLKLKNKLTILEYRKQSEVYQNKLKELKQIQKENKYDEYKVIHDRLQQYVLEHPELSLKTVLSDLSISKLTYKRITELFPRITDIRKDNIGKTRLMPDVTKKALMEGKQKFIEDKKENQKNTDPEIYEQIVECVKNNPLINLKELLNETGISQSTYVRVCNHPDRLKLQKLKYEFKDYKNSSMINPNYNDTTDDERREELDEDFN